jgi:hypothetical protein
MKVLSEYLLAFGWGLVGAITMAVSLVVLLKIYSKLAAEQEAERMRFVLQKERQEAERKRVEASGIADGAAPQVEGHRGRPRDLEEPQHQSDHMMASPLRAPAGGGS